MSWGESFGVEHPTTRIKRSALFTITALLLAIRDLWKIRQLADQAHDVERDARARLGRQLDAATDEHLARVTELHQQIAQLRANGFVAPADVESSAEPVEEPPPAAPVGDDPQA